MDAPPVFLGGRILLWIGLWLLVNLQRGRDGGALSLWIRSASSRSSWLMGIAVLIGFGSLLQLGLRAGGWWAPPGRLGMAGPLTSLFFLLLMALSTALPMEVLLRSYLPRRFPHLHPHLLASFFTAWFYLASWSPITLLIALGGGIFLTLLSRTRAPFWLLPVLHALGAWCVLCVQLP